MYRIGQKTKRNTSRILAAAAVALLVIYLIGSAEVSADRESEELRGTSFGISSIVLFLVAFTLELRERSIITSALLISGGGMMGTLSLAKEILAESGVANIATGFANTASIGYIILGMGLLHLVKLREGRD